VTDWAAPSGAAFFGPEALQKRNDASGGSISIKKMRRGDLLTGPRRIKNMTQNTEKDLTVYHDGACPLCSLEIAHYAKQEGAERLTFEDVSREDADPGEGLSRDAALRRFHVRRADGTVLSGAAGFAEIWKTLPRWRWAGRIAALPGVVHVLELFYRAFLPLRPTLARLVSRYRASD
jgi:predicted DCC family thiol-disulfide oxidoreductase YuxK